MCSSTTWAPHQATALSDPLPNPTRTHCLAVCGLPAPRRAPFVCFSTVRYLRRHGGRHTRTLTLAGTIRPLPLHMDRPVAQTFHASVCADPTLSLPNPAHILCPSHRQPHASPCHLPPYLRLLHSKASICLPHYRDGRGVLLPLLNPLPLLIGGCLLFATFENKVAQRGDNKQSSTSCWHKE